MDEEDAVIGFGARLLPVGDDLESRRKVAKYVNTPTTPICRKRDVLFGLNLARETSRALGAIIIVEGYFDVMCM